MQIASDLLVLAVSYLLGSIPFGLLIVKASTGKDIRQVESGRTGGTNAMRAAGPLAGIATAILDALKGAACVWLAQWAAPGNVWIEILAPCFGILGHNYSFFLIERNGDGKLRFRGGAGAAPMVGGAFGLWHPSLFIVVPLGGLTWYFIGYASVATLTAAASATLVFVYRAWTGASPWEYVLYGVIAFALLAWALRPNIQRLINGTERLHGYRARKNKD